MRLVQQKTVNTVPITPWYEQKNNQRTPQQLPMRGPSAFANFSGGASGMPPFGPQFGRPFPQGPRQPVQVNVRQPQRPQGAGAEFQAFFQDLQVGIIFCCCNFLDSKSTVNSRLSGLILRKG